MAFGSTEIFEPPAPRILAGSVAPNSRARTV